MDTQAKWVKVLVIFTVTALLMFAIFYVYPAQIFESRIVEYESDYTADLSLTNILFHQDLPDFVNRDALVSIRPTVRGGLVLFICIIGLPGMIAWRSVVKRYRPVAEEDHDETDYFEEE